MKKRILAILLSGAMMFSGTGTALAADVTTMENSQDELVIAEEDSEESESETVEIAEPEPESESEAEPESEPIEEEAAELEEDTVFATGLDLEGTDIEIIKGSAYDEAEFEETYSSYYVTPKLPNLRDQNPYGTCWAFATMALAEINLMNSGVISNPDLSELHLAYFGYNTVVDPLGGTKGDTYSYRKSDLLDKGGNISRAFDSLTTWTGAASESTVPYSSAASVIRSGLSDSLAYNDQVHIQGAYYTEVNLETFRSSKNVSMLNPIKKMIKNYGAAGMYFGAYNSMKGVTTDKIYDSTHKSYYNPTAIDANHAVVIVGWDDNFSRYNFAQTAPGNGAFLIRNSWATTGSPSQLDYTGYFWMSYYEKSITDYFYACKATTANDYDNNYQYDGYAYQYGSIKSEVKGANVFKAHASGGKKGEISQNFHTI